MNDNITTYVRIKDSRPECARDHIKIQNRIYNADRVLQGPDQEELFQMIRRNILEKCTRGYNCTVFAYGQTGSGKTYTIQGSEEAPGLVQRSLRYLHDMYDSLRLSFVEIYNENMIDLFEPENTVGIRDDPVDGVTVDGLSIAQSGSVGESLALYNRGIAGRRTSSTNMNACSSRSHSIFTVLLEFKDRNVVKKSKLCFVDLAGSEKCRETEADRVKETCNINRSLLCLGKIVHKLSSNDKWHISYRDSKLTFLLKDSLGGNSKLAIIGNVNLDSLPDTINTLQFLKRSKMISNNPSINYDTAGSSVEELAESLKQLDEENQLLRDEVEILRREQEHSIKSSMLFFVKKLRREFEEVQSSFAAIRRGVDEIVEGRLDDSRRAILEINDALSVINDSNRESLGNIRVKKRKILE